MQRRASVALAGRVEGARDREMMQEVRSGRRRGSRVLRHVVETAQRKRVVREGEALRAA
ncbi:MAG: hypothetical protein WDM91_08595 [Rhizomicrobium sp.]